MASSVKKDMRRYKQHPYFEKPSKEERKLISKALRKYAKMEIKSR